MRNYNGSRKKRNDYTRNEAGCKKEYRTEEEMHKLFQKDKLRFVQTGYILLWNPDGLHAPYENQCKVGRFQGL